MCMLKDCSLQKKNKVCVTADQTFCQEVDVVPFSLLDLSRICTVKQQCADGTK